MRYTLKRLPKLAKFAVIITIAACADQAPVAPVASPEIAAPALPTLVAQQAIVADESNAPVPVDPRHATSAAPAYPSGAVTYQVTFPASFNVTVTFGSHMVNFPAYTICNPAVSSYGPSSWQSPCTKLTGNITITATTWKDSKGRPQIDFANAIRFYPNYSGQLPAIYLMDPSASLSTWSRVDYCINTNGCINEAASDPVLVTRRDPNNGWLYRIIRHFSGYNVWA